VRKVWHGGLATKAKPVIAVNLPLVKMARQSYRDRARSPAANLPLSVTITVGTANNVVDCNAEAGRLTAKVTR